MQHLLERQIVMAYPVFLATEKINFYLQRKSGPLMIKHHTFHHLREIVGKELTENLTIPDFLIIPEKHLFELNKVAVCAGTVLQKTLFFHIITFLPPSTFRN